MNNDIFQTLFTKDKVCNSTQEHNTTVVTVVDKNGNYHPKKVLVEFTEPLELASLV